MIAMRKRLLYGEEIFQPRVRDRQVVWDGIFSNPDKAGEAGGRYFYNLALKRVQPGETICDAGCGHTFYLNDLIKKCGPDGLFMGIDFSAVALARSMDLAAKYSNAHLVLADLLHLPLNDGAVDRVFCSETLPYLLEEAGTALKELARVAKREVIFSLHTRGTYEIKGTETEFRGNIVIEHKSGAKPPRIVFERHEIVEMVRSTGFHVELIKPFRWRHLMEIPEGDDWPWFLPSEDRIALYYIVAAKN